MRASRTASGSGQDAIQIDLATASPAPTPGLYFLRVADASGQISPSAKLIFLR